MGIYANDVQKLYIAYFNRPADPVGLAYWEEQITKNGGSTAAVANAFSASAEYKALYDGKSSAAIVEAIYNNLFGRSAEPAGLTYWALRLENGTFSVGNITMAILTGAQNDDKKVVDNKVVVATEFTTALDTTAEILAYSGTAAANAARTFLSTVGSTDASLTAAKAAVATTISTIGSTTVANGTTYTLTAGTDTITGTANNDTINAGDVSTGTTWTVGDTVDGGMGSDTLNVTRTLAITVPVGATVTNVETVNLISGATVTANTTSGWTGLTTLNTNSVAGATVTGAATTALNVTDSALAAGAVVVNGGSNVKVTAAGQTTGTITVGNAVAAAGAVEVTAAGAYTDGANISIGNVAVTGGTSVNVTLSSGITAAQHAAAATDTTNFTLTQSAVSVTGNANTTSVTVKQDKAVTEVDSATVGKIGIANGAVTIADVNAASATAAGTIASVKLDSYGNSTIDSSALTTVDLTGTGGTLGIGRGALTATPTANTLTMNVYGLTAGAITDSEAAADDGFTTLNIVGSGDASTIANITAADVKTLNVSGSAKVTLTDNTFGALTDVTVTNTAGLVLGTTALGTAVNYAGGAGDDAVVLGAHTKAITMGAGNDTVTYGGALGTGGSVAAGDGTDTIVMTGAQAQTASGSATFNNTFTGFEVLQVTNTADTAVAINLAGINNVSKVTAAGLTAAVTLNGFVSGGTVTLTGAKGDADSDVQAVITNAALTSTDVVNVALSNSTAASVDFGIVTAADVETINISTVDAGTSTSVAATVDVATLVATSAKSIVVSGNNGLNLTNTGNVKVTSFDASGVVANGSTDTAANLAVTFTSANNTATDAVTIKGGAGNDVLAGNAAVANANTITGGEGADTITTGLGNDTFVLTETTAAVDTVVFATTANNGIDTITGFQAGATTTSDKAKLVAAATTNAAQDVAGVADFATSTNTTLTNGASAFALTGASSTTSDIVEITATLSSFGNLGAAGVVDGSELLKALSSVNVAASSITATTADDDFYMVAYQNGNAYLYQVTNGADTAVSASEIALVGVFTGVAAGAFAAGDFTV